jgi:DNA-binding GntR family transcriptional regulator
MALSEINLSETIYSRVRDTLRSDILSGAISPGTRLKINEVCKRFNISHMPVREALAQLQGEGIVIIEPNKGALVREMDDTFIRNIYQIRGALEGLLVKLSVPFLDRVDITSIEEMAKDISKHSSAGNLDEVFRLNKTFHLKIFSKADNEEAIKLLNLHWSLLGGLREKYGYGQLRFDRMNAEHMEIVEAIRDGDVMRAYRAQDIHCMNALEDMVIQRGKFR